MAVDWATAISLAALVTSGLALVYSRAQAREAARSNLELQRNRVEGLVHVSSIGRDPVKSIMRIESIYPEQLQDVVISVVQSQQADGLSGFWHDNGATLVARWRVGLLEPGGTAEAPFSNLRGDNASVLLLVEGIVGSIAFSWVTSVERVP